jgi:hypothetical protein
LHCIFAMVKSIFKFVALIVFCGIAFISCNKNKLCLKYATITGAINFTRLTDSNKVVDSSLISAICVYPSVLLEVRNFKTNRIKFLINSNQDSCTFYFKTDTLSLLSDTIDLNYTHTLNFVSKECGYNYFYSLKNIKSTNNIIKKISISDSLINDNANKKNITILF